MGRRRKRRIKPVNITILKYQVQQKRASKRKTSRSHGLPEDSKAKRKKSEYDEGGYEPFIKNENFNVTVGTTFIDRPVQSDLKLEKWTLLEKDQEHDNSSRKDRKEGNSDLKCKTENIETDKKTDGKWTDEKQNDSTLQFTLDPVEKGQESEKLTSLQTDEEHANSSRSDITENNSDLECNTESIKTNQKSAGKLTEAKCDPKFAFILDLVEKVQEHANSSNRDILGTHSDFKCDSENVNTDNQSDGKWKEGEGEKRDLRFEFSLDAVENDQENTSSSNRDITEKTNDPICNTENIETDQNSEGKLKEEKQSDSTLEFTLDPVEKEQETEKWTLLKKYQEHANSSNRDIAENNSAITCDTENIKTDQKSAGKCTNDKFDLTYAFNLDPVTKDHDHNTSSNRDMQEKNSDLKCNPENIATDQKFDGRWANGNKSKSTFEFTLDPVKNDQKSEKLTSLKTDEEHANSSRKNITENNSDLECNTETVRPDQNSDGKWSAERMDSTFEFTLYPEEWESVKPEEKIYISGRKVTVMGRNWTNLFYDKCRLANPGCTLRFVRHHISKKRNRPFFTATAVCSARMCSANFYFTIRKEPDTETSTSVHCKVQGKLQHESTDTNRRITKGSKREELQSKLQEDTHMNVFYKQFPHCTEEMEKGNFTGVPTPTALRKMVSEIVRKENLHDNIVAEIQLLKESSELANDPYVREIGIDPFCVILWDEQQLNLVKDLIKQDKLEVYFDATGSVIGAIPGQKRAFLYSIVVRPEKHLPSLSVADMVSTQHTIPRLELFLLQWKRSLAKKGVNLKVKKVETDYSYAAIQACLHVFNNGHVKSYLHVCYSIVRNCKITQDFTVLHLCSTHIFKDFIRQIKTYSGNMQKYMVVYMKRCFVMLQNSTTLHEAMQRFEDICLVFLSPIESSSVIEAKQRIDRITSNTTIEAEDDEKNEDLMLYSDESAEAEYDTGTIKEASPFTKLFGIIQENTVSEISKFSDGPDNKTHNEGFVRCLTDKFMHIFPLWSGVLIHLMNTEDFRTRDSNSPVENWFKFLKNDIGLKKKARPAKFIMLMRNAILGRINEMRFPGARQPTSKKETKRKKKTEMDIKMTLKEEKWGKGKKKKPLYQTISNPTPSKKKESGPQLPKVPKWGGNIDGSRLVNTCTIDNGLTILYLKYNEDQAFKKSMSEQTSELMLKMISILDCMVNLKFERAKKLWLESTSQNRTFGTNLYGDETDFFISHLDATWKSYTQSRCNSPTCSSPYAESKPVKGVTISLPHEVNGVQDMIMKWNLDQVPCSVEMQDDELQEGIVNGCKGRRNVKRVILQAAPILCIRIYEHCIEKRLTLNKVLGSQMIVLNNSIFVLAGITVHQANHYCAIICSERFGNLWYDGLKGKLQQLPQDLKSRSPVHAVYVQTIQNLV